MGETEYVTIDELDIPILICNSDGEIVYKNSLAKKKIRSPRLNSSIKNFIIKLHRPLLSDVQNFGRNEIIKIATKTDYTTALVCPYKRDGSKHTLWLFCSQLQFLSGTEFYHEIKDAILRTAPKLVNLVSRVDHENVCKEERDACLSDRIVEESGRFSLNVCSPKISLTMFSVDGIINILKKISDAVFSKFGYVLKISDPFVDSSDIYINNYKPFIFTYLLAINTILDFAEKNRAKLFTYTEQNELIFDIAFNIPLAEFKNISHEDYLTSDVVTKNKVNILLFVEIFNSLGYRSELYKNDICEGSYTYRLIVPHPINRKMSLRNKDYYNHNAYEKEVISEILRYTESYPVFMK